jgi:hypothetical protein
MLGVGTQSTSDGLPSVPYRWSQWLGGYSEYPGWYSTDRTAGASGFVVQCPRWESTRPPRPLRSHQRMRVSAPCRLETPVGCTSYRSVSCRLGNTRTPTHTHTWTAPNNRCMPRCRDVWSPPSVTRNNATPPQCADGLQPQSAAPPSRTADRSCSGKVRPPFAHARGCMPARPSAMPARPSAMPARGCMPKPTQSKNRSRPGIHALRGRKHITPPTNRRHVVANHHRPRLPRVRRCTHAARTHELLVRNAASQMA